ncbi:MAG: hypothetical protein JSV49_06660 [Thermoplasmata archaeon]|nr:MAG: hypothetical protein JSV49_06660 [Thermoplasmata archaeon]
MGNLSDKNIVNILEDVFELQLGQVNVYIVDRTIQEIGQTRHTFTHTDLEPFISHIKKEYSKVLGYKVDTLEADIRRAVNQE